MTAAAANRGRLLSSALLLFLPQSCFAGFVSRSVRGRVHLRSDSVFLSQSLATSPESSFAMMKKEGENDESPLSNQAQTQGEGEKRHIITWVSAPSLSDETMDSKNKDNDNSHRSITNLKQEESQQPQVQTLSFPAADGATLRTACLEGGLASPHNGKANVINCRGLGTCGTCAVEIIQGRVEPPDQNVVERTRLALPPHNNNNNNNNNTTPQLRLACQVQVCSDLIVTKRTGFWGQGDTVAAVSVPSKPFGALEYVLDARRNTSQIDPED